MISHLCALCSDTILHGSNSAEPVALDSNDRYLSHQQFEDLSEAQWQSLCELAVRHKVVPTMADGIRRNNLQPPAKISSWLAQQIKKNTLSAMRLSAELASLTRLFDQHNIGFVCFKGLALCHLAGLDFAARHSGDIDLLLRCVDDIERADEVLRSAGYGRVSPKRLAMNANQRKYFLACEKDIVYIHPEKQVQLEVHFKLCYLNRILPLESAQIFANRDSMSIGDTVIPIMNTADHQLYLFVHGAFSRWFRLKWLCDIPAISNNGKDFVHPNYFQRATELGIERMVSQGLRLANCYLEMPLSEQLSQQIQDQPAVVSRLVKSASNSLEGTDINAFSLPERLRYWATSVFTYMPFLRADNHYKINHLKPYMTKVSDWETLPLPSILFWLYFPLRPFFWLSRYLFR